MLRRVDDHLVEPGGDGGLEEVRLPFARGGPQRVARRGHPLVRLDLSSLVGLRQRRVEVGDGADPPSGAVSWPSARAIRPGLRRGAIFTALAERALLGGFAVLLGRDASEVE